MYTTCMYCQKPLGANELIESFPVGRRLAFDAAKGRLWVVCRRCQRWNLTPLEERWEAVEECERLFREIPTRAATEQIGIARHREGTELVRIGQPPRGEFAAWRYGDQFGRRRRKWMLGIAGGVGLGAAIVVAGAGVPTWLVLSGNWAMLGWQFARPIARVRVSQRSAGDAECADNAIADDEVAKFRQNALKSLRLLPDRSPTGFRIEVRKGLRSASFADEDARRVAAALMPHLNGEGGSRKSVARAVGEIESSGHPERFLRDVARRKDGEADWSGGHIREMKRPTRLALEMALHEEQERRALEGELWILERAWREAEEIAAISDNLLLPADAEAFFHRHADGRRSGADVNQRPSGE